VAGAAADKASRLVAADEPVEVVGPPSPFVSRGGLKLDSALTNFAVSVAGRRALDAGASTGGFTDCLLQRGAQHVYAVDVGHGQIDQKIRAHPRVTVLERVNVRTLTNEFLFTFDPGYIPCPLITADLSFISLTTVVPVLCGEIASADADLVLLVKPQFEAGRSVVSRGKGVIRDPEEWGQALKKVMSALQGSGTGIMGAMVSPLTGPAGNVEFLVHAVKGGAIPGDAQLAELVDGAVSEAVSLHSPAGSAG
jgi:23S rRNA (cytidine1920-2'-O)/16S rRNA (cytidine1409-2'-O)-methyltransferase